MAFAGEFAVLHAEVDVEHRIAGIGAAIILTVVVVTRWLVLAGAPLAWVAGPPRMVGRSFVLVVVEDLHWADSATLDMLRFVGRRVDGCRALVLATYRDDDVGPDHPLRGGVDRKGVG